MPVTQLYVCNAMKNPTIYDESSIWTSWNSGGSTQVNMAWPPRFFSNLSVLLIDELNLTDHPFPGHLKVEKQAKKSSGLFLVPESAGGRGRREIPTSQELQVF